MKDKTADGKGKDRKKARGRGGEKLKKKDIKNIFSLVLCPAAVSFSFPILLC